MEIDPLLTGLVAQILWLCPWERLELPELFPPPPALGSGQWTLSTSPSSVVDAKFISSPPSMVAAGSVAAAVQGLHLGATGSFLSHHCLPRFLSTVIKCDPVSDFGVQQTRTCLGVGRGSAWLGLSLKTHPRTDAAQSGSV